MGRVGAVLTPVVTALIDVDCMIGGVLGAAMTRGMPGAAVAFTIRGVPGTAMTTGGMPGDG